MKKRLEAELISIAHRVLKLKNKSEVNQLFTETQKLYEALAVLKFYGDHIEQVKATISKEELEEKLADSFEDKSLAAEPVQKEKAAEIIEEAKQVVTAEEESEVNDPTDSELAKQTKVVAIEQEEEEQTPEEAPIIVEEIAIDDDDIEEEVAYTNNDEEEQKEDIGFDPIFEMASGKMEEEAVSEASDNEKSTRGDTSDSELAVQAQLSGAKTQQISFEHLLGEDYKEPDFVKPNDITTPSPFKAEKEEEHTEILVDKAAEKPANLNEKLATGINIGLNDRIGFVKYLFDNSTEDYNRVLSQLNTFSTFADAKEFINEMVKPDYNNWVGQEDFAERFMEIVEKKFG